MKFGKTYIASDGVQYAMYPNEVMNITQSINGQYSHQGTNAIDDAQQDTGISNGAAFADVVCVATDYVNGNAMFWQTEKKVRTVKYGDCYLSFMVIHDNTANAYVGMRVKQGEQLFSEGTVGRATGNHNHMEVAPQKFSKMYVLNSCGVYMMPGNVNPADIFFVDDTKIINGGGLNWQTIPQNKSVNFDEMEQEHYAVKYINDVPISIHENSSEGAIIGTFVKGEIQEYTRKGAGNGHRWIGWEQTINGKNYKCVSAISGSETRGEEMWVELVEPPKQETDKPEESVSEDNVKQEETEKQDYTKNIKYYGCDVSSHNGENYNPSDFDFVIIRASYGTNEDEQYKNNVKRCQEAGVPFGLYCYSYALDNEGAKAEADFIRELMERENIVPELGVWFDMEDADGYKAKNGALTKENCANFVNTFCGELKKNGYYTGYYTATSWLSSFVVGVEFPLWVANWGINDGNINGDFSDIAVIHQYTSTPLDKNASYLDIENFKSYKEKDEDKEEDSNDNQQNESEEYVNVGIISLLSKIVEILEKILEKIGW